MSDDSVWMSHLLGELEPEKKNMWSEDMNMMHEHYNVHESIEKMDKDTIKYIPIDQTKLENADKSLRLQRKKPVITINALEKSMNLKYS